MPNLIVDLTPEQQKAVEAFAREQARTDQHPLTCGFNSTHRPLALVFYTDGPLLRCPDCSWSQLTQLSSGAKLPRLASVPMRPASSLEYVQWCMQGGAKHRAYEHSNVGASSHWCPIHGILSVTHLQEVGKGEPANKQMDDHTYAWAHQLLKKRVPGSE